MYSVFYARYQVPLYCGEHEFPKYYVQDCVRISFSSLHFDQWLDFLKTILFLSPKKVLSEKTSPTKTESFPATL